MSINVSIQKNPTQAGKYRAVLHTGRKRTFDNFLQHVEASSTITESDALAVLTAAAKWLEANAGDGREVDLGPLGSSRLGMQGSFDDVPKRILGKDVRLTVNWQLPLKLKTRVAKQGERLVRKRVDGEPKHPSILDVRPILDNGRLAKQLWQYRAGRALRIAGSNLGFDGEAPDEGIFMHTADGTVWQLETIITRSATRCTVLLPDDVTGNFSLEIFRRHPKGHGRLVSSGKTRKISPMAELKR